MTRRDQQHRDQPDLFDSIRDAAAGTSPRHLHRRGDPVTSVIGAQVIAERLTGIKGRLYREFIGSPGLTALEAADKCVRTYGGSRESYRKRAGELEKEGRIRVSGQRRCKITGNTAQTYEVNQ